MFCMPFKVVSVVDKARLTAPNSLLSDCSSSGSIFVTIKTSSKKVICKTVHLKFIAITN